MTDDLRPRAARITRAPRHGVRRIVALCAALVGGACTDHEVPAALVGRWTSPDPRYQGRSLAISPAMIEFETGGPSNERFLIERVDSELAGDGVTLHVIHYRGADGTPQTVRLELLAPRGPSLRFENHEEVWVREARGPEPRRGGS